MTNRDYEVGDVILVPWGLDLVEGIVVGAYGEGSSLRVLVEVGVGEGVTEVLPFSSRALEGAQALKEKSPPGSWVNASRYEESLSRVLNEMLRSRLTNWRGHLEHAVRLEDGREIDIRAQLPDRTLFVEAKYYSDEGVPLRPSLLDQVAAHVSGSRVRAPRMVALFVTNAKVQPAAMYRAEGLRQNGVPLWVAMWRPWGDVSELEGAVSEALNFPIEA